MFNFITLRSLKNRAFTSLLCILSIALSVMLYLGIQRVRKGAEDGFTHTISQTDFIVGAKGGALNLLLYSVFHLGSPVNNVRMSSYEEIKNLPGVKWTIPISLGDSYKGFRVVGTDQNFFEHYRYRKDQKVELEAGMPLNGVFDVVIGAEVAKRLKHKVGDDIVLTHGIQSEGLYHHEKTPFKIIGIIKKTETPIDKSVYVTLHGMEAMHIGWETGVPSDEAIDPSRYLPENLEIKQITSFMVGLKNRIAILKLRRFIDQYEAEPLMAIIPALTLQEMWQTLSYVEKVLTLVGLAVLLVGFLTIVIALYTSINERRKEMSIFRSLGAHPWQIFGLILYESFLLVLFGIILGVGFLYAFMMGLKPILETEFSLFLEITALSRDEWSFIILLLFIAPLIGFIPGYRAYKNSLRDGLS